MTKRVVGMLHLPPLPGSPRAEWSLSSIEEQVLSEARLLAETGFDGAILENFGDAPFFKEGVDAVTIAAMTRLASVVRKETPGLDLGVNVLRNDAAAALAVAAASGASFIRVNVHVGATATDQGIIEGRAADTLRRRAAIGARVAIWADVHVKHGRSLAHDSIEDEALDASERGLADALIVSGKATGKSASLNDVKAVKGLGLPAPVYVGSGVSEDTVGKLLGVADGVIVGTSIKIDGVTTNPIDRERARRIAERVKTAQS